MIEDITLGEFIDFHKDLDKDITNDELEEKFIKAFITKFYKDKKYTNIAALSAKLNEEIAKAKEELVMVFTLNNVEYGFIPDLENITFGEVIDLDEYLPYVEHHHRLMAILYRPISDHQDGKYAIADYHGTKGYCDLLRNMPLAYYFSALGFFESLGEALQKPSPSYSERHLEKRIATTLYLQEKLSATVGAGIKAWYRFRTTISQSLSKFRNLTTPNVLRSLSSTCTKHK